MNKIFPTLGMAVLLGMGSVANAGTGIAAGEVTAAAGEVTAAINAAATTVDAAIDIKDKLAGLATTVQGKADSCGLAAIFPLPTTAAGLINADSSLNTITVGFNADARDDPYSALVSGVATTTAAACAILNSPAE